MDRLRSDSCRRKPAPLPANTDRKAVFVDILGAMDTDFNLHASLTQSPNQRPLDRLRVSEQDNETIDSIMQDSPIPHGVAHGLIAVGDSRRAKHLPAPMCEVSEYGETIGQVAARLHRVAGCDLGERLHRRRDLG